jgi:putative ABC transport system permease protein
LINRLVLENLKHRKVRTALSALSIGFQVTMILTVVGLSRGMLEDSARRARNVNADIWVKPPGASAISLSGPTMPEKIMGWFREQPGITAVSGTLVVPLTGITTVTGLEIDEFTAISGHFRFLSGGPFRGPDDVMIDSWYAEQSKKKVGDTLRFLNRDWRVCGVVEAGVLARMIVRRDRLQFLTNNSDRVSQVFLKVDDRRNTTAIISALKKDLPDYTILSIEEFISYFNPNNVPALNAFIWVIIGLAVVVGFLVVGLTMYTTVLERTREIGILKALGAAPADIINLLARETIMLALAGWFCGVLLTFVTNWTVNRFVRASLQSVITYDWWPIVMAIAVAAALLGAIYPGLRAARQDAIEALAYE